MTSRTYERAVTQAHSLTNVQQWFAISSSRNPASARQRGNMSCDNDRDTTTLILTDNSLAIPSAKGAQTFRLSNMRDASEAVMQILGLIGSRGHDLTRILLNVGDPARAAFLKHAAVALAGALGAQLGEFTPLGLEHMKSVNGRASGDRAAWLAHGMHLLREMERVADFEISIFEIKMSGEPLLPEQRAENIAQLLDACRRYNRFFWRKVDSASLSESVGSL